MGESIFLGGGEAVWFVVEMLLCEGVEMEIFMGRGLFVRGVVKNISSFKDKTFICLLREEELIPCKGGAIG